MARVEVFSFVWYNGVTDTEMIPARKRTRDAISRCIGHSWRRRRQSRDHPELVAV